MYLALGLCCRDTSLQDFPLSNNLEHLYLKLASAFGVLCTKAGIWIFFFLFTDTDFVVIFTYRCIHLFWRMHQKESSSYSFIKHSLLPYCLISWVSLSFACMFIECTKIIQTRLVLFLFFVTPDCNLLQAIVCSARFTP